jgi:Spy/CpxP family protein refolding chaperone
MKKLTAFLALTFIAGALTLSAQDQPKQNSKPPDKKESKMWGKDCKMSCCKSKTTEKDSKAPEKKN